MTIRTIQLDDTLYRYLLDHSVREHPAQAALREATRDHPHANMQIGPDQAQMMALLVRLIGARRTIEVGVFTGYSTLSVALALPDDGRVLACDIEEAFVRIGYPHWQAAGVRHKIDLPPWVPPTGPEAGFGRVSPRRAMDKGLRFRPLAATVKDTLDYWHSLPAERRDKPRAGLTPAREAELLALFRQSTRP